MTGNFLPSADTGIPAPWSMQIQASLQPLTLWKPAPFPDRDPVNLPLLYWLARQVAPKLTLCLGVGTGGAHFALCDALRDLDLSGQRRAAQVFGIDRWTDADGQVEPGVPTDLAEHARTHHADRSRLICADPNDAVDFFDLGNIDMLVVDLPLSEELGEQIRTQWGPLMSPHGVIVVRGFARDAALPGGLRAIWPHMTLSQGDGALVLLAGDSPVPLLADLCAAPSDDPDRAQALGMLYWMGSALADRQNHAQTRASLAQMQTKLDQSHAAFAAAEQDRQQSELSHMAALATRDQRLASLAREAEEKDTELARLRAQAADTDRALEALTRQAEAFRSEKDRLAGDLAQADTARTNLEADRDHARTALAGAQSDLAKLQARESATSEAFSALTKEAETLQADRDRLKGDLAQAETARAQIETRLGQVQTDLTQARASIQDLTARTTGLSADKETLVQELAEAEAARAQLEQRLVQSRAEVAAAQDDLARLEAEHLVALDTRDARLAEMAREAEKRSAELTRIETQSNEQIQALTALTREAESLHARLAAAEKRAGRLPEVEAAMTKLRADAARRVDEIKERLALAVSQRDSAREQMDSLKEEAHRRVTELKDRLALAVTQRDAAREKVESLKVGLKARESALQSLQEKAQAHQDALQAELAAMRASTSWRVTTPLRKIRSAFSSKP